MGAGCERPSGSVRVISSASPRRQLCSCVLQPVFSSKREVLLQGALFFVQYAQPQHRCALLRSIDLDNGVISRYTIDRHTDVDRIFNVHAGNGSIFLQKPLDREDLAWHNISVIAVEFSKSRTHAFTWQNVRRATNQRTEGARRENY